MVTSEMIVKAEPDLQNVLDALVDITRTKVRFCLADCVNRRQDYSCNLQEIRVGRGAGCESYTPYTRPTPVP